MFYLYFITPLLGCLRNYVKYKQLKFFMFIRTPLTYFFINVIFQCNSIWKTLMYERWIFFFTKHFYRFIMMITTRKKQSILRSIT